MLVTGGFTVPRAGLARLDEAWQAVGRSAVLAARGVRPVLHLTSHAPRRTTPAAVPLRAAGPGVVFDVVEIGSPDGTERLARSREGRSRRPAPARVLEPATSPALPDLRTTVTEVVTGLATLGYATLGDALVARPAELVNVGPGDLGSPRRRRGRRCARRRVRRVANGCALLAAREGLRGRRPLRVEWKGSVRAPGDEVVPADLRIDHVFFVSCKYLSRIVINASPAHLFERLLRGGHGQRGSDWFDDVAPAAHQALYRASVPGDATFPARVVDLLPYQRRQLAERLRSGWPGEARPGTRSWPARWPWPRRAAGPTACAAATTASACCGGCCASGRRPTTCWAPRPVQVRRCACGWAPRGDWQQQFELRSFAAFPQAGGQPRVGWRATVRDRLSAVERVVEGHVEIRWSHGRFCGPPEAKVYLDTAHREVPGYVPLA